MDKYYVLFSGGVDSTLATLKVLASDKQVSVTPLFFDYGQRNASQELTATQQLIQLMRSKIRHESSKLDNTRVYKIQGLFSWSDSPILKWGKGDKDNPDLENRNMVLLSCAASIIMTNWKPKRQRGERAFIIAGFKNEHYDTKARFADRLNCAFRSMQMPIKVITPLILDRQREKRVSSHQLTKIAHKLDVLSVLKKTWSCYYPLSDNRTCETCTACLGRNDFFKELKTRVRLKKRL